MWDVSVTESHRKKKVKKNYPGIEASLTIETKEHGTKNYSSYSPLQPLFVTFTLPLDYAGIGKLNLPAQFIRDNHINKPGEIYLLGKDGTKQHINLTLDKKGTMSLGKGWKYFVKTNGIEKGFTVKFTWEGTIPLLSLCSSECSGGRRAGGEWLETCTREPGSGETNTKDDDSKEEREKNYLRNKHSTSKDQNRFVTLTLTPEDIKVCKLDLPIHFMRANGINKLGKITFLGKDGSEWLGHMLRKDGFVALGCGWKDFCEANGVMTGENFSLEFVFEKDKNVVLKFCSQIVPLREDHFGYIWCSSGSWFYSVVLPSSNAIEEEI